MLGFGSWEGGGGAPPLRRANGTPCHIQHSPNTPTTRLRERGNDTSKSTGRSGRQKAATRRNLRREERVTVQGPVKEQQPDRMSHRGGGGQSPEMVLLSWQLATSIDFSPLTKIYQAAVLAYRFCFSMVASRGTNTLRIPTAIIFSAEAPLGWWWRGRAGGFVLGGWYSVLGMV